jgi:hypothetical protein
MEKGKDAGSGGKGAERVHIGRAVLRFADTSISKFSTKLKPAAGTKYGW